MAHVPSPLLLLSNIFLIVLVIVLWQSGSGDASHKLLTSHTLQTGLAGVYEATLEDRKWVLETSQIKVKTMVAPVRLKLTLDLGRVVIQNGVPGDFVETGTYIGGTTIMLHKTLEKYDKSNLRQIWAADSFEGLPSPHEKDASGPGKARKDAHAGKYSVSKEDFMAHLARYNSMTERVHILKGFFKDTLPTAPIKQIAFLRLDGDLYESTRDALTALYDKVSPGGAIYVDDYESYGGCKQAVDEFRESRNIKCPLYTQGTDEKGTYHARYWFAE